VKGIHKPVRLTPTVDEQAIEDFATKVPARYNHGWRNGATDCLTR
jgi:hypothetical protein